MMSTRRTAHAFKLLVLLLGLLAGACTGGQTGDEGLGNPDEDGQVGPRPVNLPEPPDPPAICASLPRTHMPAAPGLRWPSHGAAPVLIVADGEGYLFADYGFGLRHARVRDAGLEVGPALRLSLPPRHLFDLGGERALVVTDDAVHLVTTAGKRPALVGEPVALSGVPRGATLLQQGAGKPATLAVLTDVLDDPEAREDQPEACIGRARSEVVRVAILADGLAEQAAIDLGSELSVARFEDGDVWAVRAGGPGDDGLGDPDRPAELVRRSLLDPAAPALRWPLAGEVMQPDDLHVDRAAGAVDVLTSTRFGLAAHFQRFGAATGDANPLFTCELLLAAGRDRQASVRDRDTFVRGHRSLFLGDTLIVADRLSDVPAPNTAHIVTYAEGACDVRGYALPPAASLAAGPDGSVLAWGAPVLDTEAPVGEPYVGELSVVLFAPGSGEPFASLTLPGQTEDGAPRGYWPSAGRVISDAAGGPLLLVPSSSVSPAGEHRTELHVLRVGAQKLEEQAALSGLFGTAPLGDRLWAAGPTTTALYELSQLGELTALATADIFPTAGAAWLIGGAVVSQRPEVPTPDFVVGDISGTATLDVRADLDALLLRTQTLSMPSARRFVRAGEVLVGFESTGYACDTVPDQTLRVVALDDERALDARGTLTLADLDLRFCVRSELSGLSRDAPSPVLGLESSNGLQLLDLHDPTQPVLYPVPPMPGASGEGRSLMRGTRIYQSFLRSEGGNGLTSYLREVDAAKPGAPVLSEPIEVPGAIAYADGDAMWFVDRDSDGAIMLLRGERVDRAVHVRASVEIPYEPTSVAWLEGGILVAGFEEGVSGLVVPYVFFDADTLEEVGRVQLPQPTRARGASGAVLVVEDAWQNQTRLLKLTRSPEHQGIEVVDLPGAQVADLRDGVLLLLRGTYRDRDAYADSNADGALDWVDLNDPSLWPISGGD